MNEGLGLRIDGYTTKCQAPFDSTSIDAARREREEVLIVDPLAAMHTHIKNLLSDLSTQPAGLITAFTGREAIDIALARNPSLLVMEVDMPGLNGIKTALRIWSTLPGIKILFYSAHLKEAHIRQLMHFTSEHSTWGYLLKGSKDEVFLYALQSLLVHDNAYLDPAVRILKARLAKQDCLSEIELATLEDLALGLTDKAIAARRNISLRGVQNRISNLYTKLLNYGDAQLTRTTRGAELVNLRVRLIFEGVILKSCGLTD